MPRGAVKGGRFEREICVKLSRWWSGGKRDDIFWRTGGSGARATVRHRAGKKTRNQHGDVCAVDPAGMPFINAVTISLKRGYNRETLADLIDKPAGAKTQTWEKWISEARESAKAAGTPYWMIIAQRDRREAIVVCPKRLNNIVLGLGQYAAIYDEGAYIHCIKFRNLLVVPPGNFEAAEK